MTTTEINLSALTDAEIKALTVPALRSGLKAAGVTVGTAVRRKARLLALVADLLGRPLGTDAPPPVQVATEIKGIRVYRESDVAASRARAALASLPVYGTQATDGAGLDGLDGYPLALATATGVRPVGGKRDVWALLGEKGPNGTAAPGKVQTLARWLCAVVAARPVALARPVRLVVKADGETAHALDRIKAAPFGGIDLAPAANHDGTAGRVIGYTPRAVVNGGALAIVKAAGVPGVTPGVTVSAAIEKIQRWAIGWRPDASADDGAGVIGNAWNEAVTVARVAWNEKIAGDARAALAAGSRAGTAHRLGVKARNEAERARLQRVIGSAVSVKLEKLTPIA